MLYYSSSSTSSFFFISKFFLQNFDLYNFTKFKHDQHNNKSSKAEVQTKALIPNEYYKILEVDYDATEEAIRSNYIRLALKWHPDKHEEPDGATSKFQEINEAYQVLSDLVKRQEYDQKGMMHVYGHNIVKYLNRYKGLILTCNGLGMKHSIW